MSKLEERNAEGVETTMLHLDELEHCKGLFNDSVAKQSLP